MPIGTCGLCMVDGELKDSHLLPKSIYKRLRKAIELDGQKNPNPIMINVDAAKPTSAQVTDYFLCGNCEQAFNSNGEKWMAENCWQPDNTFPLRDSLHAAKPVHRGKNGLEIYEASAIKGVDVHRIVYFASSVFWRAAAHQFGAIFGSKPDKLTFGPYEEQLRQFLLAQAPFPKHAALVVTVGSETDAGANEFALFPFRRNKKSGAMEYGFAIPGIGFQLFLGKSIPDTVAAMAIAPSTKNIIFLGPLDGALRDLWKIYLRSQPKAI